MDEIAEKLWRCELFKGTYLFESGFPGGAGGKEPACQCGRCKTRVRPLDEEDPAAGGHGNPLQYYGLENPMDRGAWRAMVHSVARVGHD